MAVNSIRLLAMLPALLMLPPVAFAQSTPKQKQKQLQTVFDQEDYFRSYQLAKEMLAADPKNRKAPLILAASAFRMSYPVDSLLPFSSMLSASSDPEAAYALARIYHRQKRFPEAIVLLEKALKERRRSVSAEEIRYRIRQSQYARDMMANPRRSVIKNLGPEINSQYPDYVPVMFPDEQTLYFSSRRPGFPPNGTDAWGRPHEDIFVSRYTNGKWTPAENAGLPLNSASNDACVAVSPDGQRMIIYRTAPDKISGDLYLTKIGDDGNWTEPEILGQEINSQFIETSACFSLDTSTIYFSSNRPGGYGGKDIYRIRRLPNGRWALPYNLGPSVNTVHDEDAPFLHSDGITLYFSSKGHNSMGEYDVFRSVLNEETNKFSPAENLGYPVNTVENDIFFMISVDGQRAWYSSEKEDSYGATDIYFIDTRYGDNDLRVKHGTAYKGGKPAKIKITLLDNESNSVNGTYFSNPLTGRFIVVINPLKSYKAIVESDGFATQVHELEPMLNETEEKLLEFRLQKAN